MTEDYEPTDSPQAPRALTLEDILSSRLTEFDAPAAGVRMVVLSHKNAGVLQKDSENEELDDRTFIVAFLARQVIDPPTTPEEVAGWDDKRLLAALTAFVAQKDVFFTPDGEPVTFAAFRDVVRAKAEADRAKYQAMLGPLGASQLFGVSQAIRDMMRSKVDFSAIAPSYDLSAITQALRTPGVLGTTSLDPKLFDAVRAATSPLSKTITETTRQAAERLGEKTTPEPLTFVPRPDYEAKAAFGIERLAEYQEAGIEVAEKTQDEIVTLHQSVGETNNELRKLRASTAPRWVSYMTLVVAVAALLFAIWNSQPHGATAPAASPTPSATVVTTPYTTAAPTPTPPPTARPTPAEPAPSAGRVVSRGT